MELETRLPLSEWMDVVSTTFVPFGPRGAHSALFDLGQSAALGLKSVNYGIGAEKITFCGDKTTKNQLLMRISFGIFRLFYFIIFELNMHNVEIS